MSYILFDFETTGIQESDGSPQRAIQLAWMILDPAFNIVSVSNYFIKGQQNINTDFHRPPITADYLNIYGRSPLEVIPLFLQDVEYVLGNNGYLVAHNIDFDYKVLINEIKHELGSDYTIDQNRLLCTMKMSIDVCKLPKRQKLYNNQSQYKWPKLIELYRHFYKEDPKEELHDALNDVIILKACFEKLYV